MTDEEEDIHEFQVWCDGHKNDFAGKVCPNSWIEKKAYIAAKRRDREIIKGLTALVLAVTATEFSGIFCDDVDGKNWFDERNRLIDKARKDGLTK